MHQTLFSVSDHISMSGYGLWLLSTPGLSSPVGDCDPGFYCLGGNSEPNPPETPCPIGLHCPGGSSLPVPCAPGFFANFSQAAECVVCPAGYYCVPEEVIEGK